MSFLPKDYEAPASWGNYLKFKKGITKIRIMSESIQGYLDWKDNKPVRTREKQPAFDPDKKPKHFRAFVVWDYEDNKIKVCEITQKGIQDAIYNLYIDEDWGDPKEYDLKITKEGDGMDTKYAVVASPKKELTEEMEKAYKDANIYLEALFEWDDPFNYIPENPF